MMLGGDEMGRTQHGNNNAYCQDNELSWLDWSLVKTNADLLRFVRTLIRLRLDSREGWMTGGERGPAIIPGDPEQSLVIRAVRYQDSDLQMPPATS